MQAAPGAGTGRTPTRARALLAKIQAGRVADGVLAVRDVYLKGWAHLGTPEAVRLPPPCCVTGHLRRVDTKPGSMGGRADRPGINPKRRAQGADA